jgi:hypothetical protein
VNHYRATMGVRRWTSATDWTYAEACHLPNWLATF